MDREMASTAPISQPSQYMMATTRQITPDKHQQNLNVHERISGQAHCKVQDVLPIMVMSTGSSSRGCAVNTDTAATQMPRDSRRLQRAVSTPTSSHGHILHIELTRLFTQTLR